MSEKSLRAHPLMVITATTVILTCLLAVGVMTGIIPSPLTRDRATPEATVSAPAERSAMTGPNTSARSAAPAPRERTVERDRAAARERTAERPPVGSTSSSAASGTASGGSAPKVAAVCTNCGTVTSVSAVKKQGDAGLIGPIAGGALGGLAGSQIGGGSGKTIATIVGAAGGAAVGTEVERRSKATTSYVVGVRLNDGSTRSFTYGNAPGVQEGDKVRVVEGRLVRDS
jgi:outer membrane lipoprotein SlyB